MKETTSICQQLRAWKTCPDIGDLCKRAAQLIESQRAEITTLKGRVYDLETNLEDAYYNASYRSE